MGTRARGGYGDTRACGYEGTRRTCIRRLCQSLGGLTQGLTQGRVRHRHALWGTGMRHAPRAPSCADTCMCRAPWMHGRGMAYLPREGSSPPLSPPVPLALPSCTYLSPRKRVILKIQNFVVGGLASWAAHSTGPGGGAGRRGHDAGGGDAAKPCTTLGCPA